MDLTALQVLLKNYRDELDLIAVAVVDRAGLIIASEMKDVDEDIVGATTAMIDSYVERLQSEFGSQKRFFHITSAEEKKFAYSAAGTEALLTSIGSQDIPDIKLKVYSQHVSEKVRRIIDGEEQISPKIPEIVRVMGDMRDGKFPKGEYSTKLIITGSYQAGKSSLIRRFVENKFQESYIATIGVEISKKTLNVSKNCDINFILWDIGGQFSQMEPYRKRFYGGTNAIFIVVDRTRKETLDAVETWYKDMKKSLPDIDKLPVVIIGNKSDLLNELQISTDDLKNKAQEHTFHFIETSAKTGENVQDAFSYIAYRILQGIYGISSKTVVMFLTLSKIFSNVEEVNKIKGGGLLSLLKVIFNNVWIA